MGTWFKIAFRNILKHARRSIVTMFAIGIGFAAITLFRGYTHDMYSGLRLLAISGEGLGHLTIYKQGWLEKRHMDPETYMFTPQELQRIREVAEANADVILMTPQLSITGLVSNGRISTVFVGQGVVPHDDQIIKNAWTVRANLQGKPIQDDYPSGVEVATELARILEVQPGDFAVAITSTLEGQMNALDIDVRGVYDTGIAATNDKFMRLPFRYAQRLYDTEKADRMVVMLDAWQKTDTTRVWLLQQLSSAGVQVDIKTWQDLSILYTRIKRMFDMIFLFIFIIVLVIVGMSVVNTMSMAVLERTREIGTLRALGLKRRGVRRLFATEGAILGVLGVGTGGAISLSVWALMHYLEPSYTPPYFSAPVPLMVDLVPQYLVQNAVFLLLLSLLAAILPARHAAKQKVVDALGHV